MNDPSVPPSGAPTGAVEDSVSPDAAASHSMPVRRRLVGRKVRVAIAADVVSVLAFVLLGRNAHDEGNAVTGTLIVVLPFLIGVAAGWIVERAWLNPFQAWPSGVVVWLTTLVTGLVLRRFVFDGDGERGTATAFVIVATLFTCLFMIGWRLVATELLRRRRHPRR